MKTLSPLIERIEADIMASDLLRADDTPIRVLDRSRRDKGLGKGVKQGRILAYVRDQRPWAGAAPPSAVYRFAPDWKEEHVLSHLADARGILQADGYKGYAKLYLPEPGGRVAPARSRLLGTPAARLPRFLDLDQIRDRLRGTGPDRQTLGLSRFRAAPIARLGHLTSEGDRAFQPNAEWRRRGL
jgi:hypothetical protein